MASARHFHNRRFFSIPDRLNSYWAGFIAADGTIDPTNSALRIGLGAKDRAHLEEFAADIEFTGPIQPEPKTRSYRVNLYGAHEVIYDLENCFEIVPRKSLTLKPPLELERWGEDAIKSYIAGYIDGDGCIKLCKRDGCIILDLFTGSEALIEWLRDTVERLYSLPRKRIYKYAGVTGFTYRLQGKNAIKVLSDLRSVSPVSLERKWSKLDA